ncbi:guanine nucleotide exchange factor subunit Rich-like [Phlebotomus argentipes]|uniref:guanine nucleotide exchange factor subunit Rich-like n=1 Tax=Phlebotomus argentipes TaxID=94469 RepID=UPI0028932CB4|nr:guanine nucleotide exchange factor subunit Rich-like [Phlebotomus argentipes]XP_059620644.1 guanine nucleotide exchange factor subunit Rich-like [Phlebotomus argentipes]
MYFPVGWPKILDIAETANGCQLLKICCDRVKILFAILTEDSLRIWYTKPCVPIVCHRRDAKSIEKHGRNMLVEWKPDSSMLVIVTEDGTLLLFSLGVVDTPKGIYNQIDSPFQNLRRDSAELFVKETIPSLTLTLSHEVALFVPVTCVSCVSISQMMVATESGKVLRIRWDGVEERDFSLDLKRIPFSVNQQVSYAVPILEDKVHITSMDYSPLVGGFAITLNDGRAAFLTANNLKFDPNQVQGIWAQNIDDASCATINHKYRLIAFGRKNSQAVVYTIDDLTGGLELSHALILSAKDFPGSPGAVREMKWTPDGCAVVLSWCKGGISLWSTFGSTLMCSLGWDYGLNVDLAKHNPLDIQSMDWSTEGYQLFMVRHTNAQEVDGDNASTAEPSRSLLVLDFVKSSMSVNPCMSFHSHLLLQGDDKLYMNQGESLRNIHYNSRSYGTDLRTFDSPFYTGCKQTNFFATSYSICTTSYINDGEIKRVANDDAMYHSDDYELGKSLQVTSILSESKHWIVVQLPTAYMASNWPIRYSAIDKSGVNLAVAGRLGFALYSLGTRKWKLFGNETQEKDFVVTGGLLWWNEFIIMGCYSMVGHSDELRLYPKDAKLDNRFAKIIPSSAPVVLINLYKDQLIVFTNDGFVTSFAITRHDAQTVDLTTFRLYDIRGLCVHPACIVSVTMTNLKNESIPRVNQASQQSETLILNVSGRLLMVQKENNGNTCEHLTSTCLASCVECIWLSDSHKTHLKESLWLFCGGHGMRVWLPVFPRREGDSGHRSHRHTFMSRRIMLSFTLRVYPLVILFEDAIILGVENDTVLYTSDSSLHFSLPFCVLERTSQVYLHQILRQLIRRNLGYNAWEIARSCTNLPYFPHSLELLLHEVLEEEATSKEPIPDALLPSVLEFIQEFPVYLQTVVQCARKTEIALWPYLFATAGKPKDLFQQCLASKQLETAASYLIILQNLEPSSISRQYATLLLDTALEQSKWELARDLVRFLRAIDPNDVESPRTSFVMGQKLGLSSPTTPVSPNAEDLSLIMGSMARGRSFSTTMNPKQQPGEPNLNTSPNSTKEKTPPSSVTVQKRKKSMPHTQKEKDSSTAEDFFIDVILQRHARRLLQERKLEELGYMSAALDFHLVGWLSREKDRAARIEDFVAALKQLHEDLEWPKPSLELKLNPDADKSNQTQESPSYSLQSLKIETNLGASDSGYTSLPGQQTSLEMPMSCDEGHLKVHRRDSGSKLLLKTATVSVEAKPSASNNNVEGRKPKLPSISEAEAKLVPMMENMSVTSEQVSFWGDENSNAFTPDIEHQAFANPQLPSVEEEPKLKTVSHKLEVKMRYLLQIFTEAGCLEFSLLLSILLLDAASICRITNAAVRTGSLQLCRQLRNGLKDIMRWSFQECLGYRSFAITLQPQIYQLDKFVLQKESIPPLQFVSYSPTQSFPMTQIPSSDKVDPATKNTQSSIKVDHQTFDHMLVKSNSVDRSTAAQTESISSDREESTQSNPANSSVLSFNDLPKPESTGCVLM